MNYSILVSRTFQRQFHKLDLETQQRVRTALQALALDPFQKRPKADIKVLVNTVPPKHRLRVGNHRIIYSVERRKVLVIEIFRRGRGYR